MAVFPSPERATDQPCCATCPITPVPTSLQPCWLHTPPERVYTHAAPIAEESRSPPTIAAFPSPDRDTDTPCWEEPTAPVPTSLEPCWFHTLPERVYTQAAPT